MMYGLRTAALRHADAMLCDVTVTVTVTTTEDTRALLQDHDLDRPF